LWISNKLFIHQADTFPYKISIDLVPCLRTGHLLKPDTPFARFTAEYDNDLKVSYAVFKQPNYVFGPEMSGLCPATFVRLEAEVIRRSPMTVRAAFMWLKKQFNLTHIHKRLLKFCLLHCIVENQFDEAALSDKVTEHSVRLCLSAIMSRLMESIHRDEVPSNSDPDQLWPVWESEPFARYSMGLLAQLGLKYPPPENLVIRTYSRTFNATDTLTREVRITDLRISKTVQGLGISYRKVNELVLKLTTFVSNINSEHVSNAALINDEALMRKITMYEDCRNDSYSFMNVAKVLDKLDTPYRVSTNYESQMDGEHQNQYMTVML